MSLGIVFIGFFAGYFLFKYQKIFNGYLFLFLFFLTYIFIGIGFYGILKFLLIKLIKVIFYFIKLIVKGKIVFGFNDNRFYLLFVIE